MTNPVPRRRQPWGAVLMNAPWDGRPVPAEPVRMPATAAAPVPTGATAGPPSHRRKAFGSLLAGAPWAGAKRPPASPAQPSAESADQDTILEVVE